MRGLLISALVCVAASLLLGSCAAPVHLVGLGNGFGHPGLGRGQSCGGVAGLQCGAGLYCAYEPRTCHADDATGVCEAKPTACTEVSEPICGCDSKTYASTCLAAQAGTSPASRGQCPDLKHAKLLDIF